MNKLIQLKLEKPFSFMLYFTVFNILVKYYEVIFFPDANLRNKK